MRAAGGKGVFVRVGGGTAEHSCQAGRRDKKGDVVQPRWFEKKGGCGSSSDGLRRAEKKGVPDRARVFVMWRILQGKRFRIEKKRERGEGRTARPLYVFDSVGDGEKRITLREYVAGRSRWY